MLYLLMLSSESIPDVLFQCIRQFLDSFEVSSVHLLC